MYPLCFCFSQACHTQWKQSGNKFCLTVVYLLCGGLVVNVWQAVSVKPDSSSRGNHRIAAAETAYALRSDRRCASRKACSRHSAGSDLQICKGAFPPQKSIWPPMGNYGKKDSALHNGSSRSFWFAPPATNQATPTRPEAKPSQVPSRASTSPGNFIQLKRDHPATIRN